MQQSMGISWLDYLVCNVVLYLPQTRLAHNCAEATHPSCAKFSESAFSSVISISIRDCLNLICLRSSSFFVSCRTKWTL
uniref:Uncharacterized protein n=1 Tax=Populus trichocarpa TaxID=3694 RepID=A0A2K1ZM48_POPTR